MQKKPLRNLVIAKEFLIGKKLREISTAFKVTISEVDIVSKSVYRELIPEQERLKWLSAKAIIIEYRDVLKERIDKKLEEFTEIKNIK